MLPWTLTPLERPPLRPELLLGDPYAAGRVPPMRD